MMNVRPVSSWVVIDEAVLVDAFSLNHHVLRYMRRQLIASGKGPALRLRRYRGAPDKLFDKTFGYLIASHALQGAESVLVMRRCDDGR